MSNIITFSALVIAILPLHVCTICMTDCGIIWSNLYSLVSKRIHT